MLTAEAIQTAKDYEESAVAVPEWGGEVRVRTLSMGARYEINVRSVKGGEIDHSKFAAATLEFGIAEPKLTREQAEKMVAERAPEPINRIVEKVWNLSGVKENTAKNA